MIPNSSSRLSRIENVSLRLERVRVIARLRSCSMIDVIIVLRITFDARRTVLLSGCHRVHCPDLRERCIGVHALSILYMLDVGLFVRWPISRGTCRVDIHGSNAIVFPEQRSSDERKRENEALIG